METKDGVLLKKILGEIEVIEEVKLKIDFPEFIADKVCQHAVVMALLNSGELSRSISPEIRERAPHIPWMQIIGLRNVAAHGYASLSMLDIWKTITDDIPLLQQNIENLLKELS